MWIKPLERRRPSGSDNVNFLWKDDAHPLYLSDNHLAALWAWRREFRDRDEPYIFVHIDTHWDAREVWPDDFMQLEACWDSLASLEDLTSLLRVDGPHAAPIRMILYDNYIDPFLRLYPRLERAYVTAHQDYGPGGALGKAISVYRGEIVSLQTFFESIDSILCDDSSTTPIILNIDIDYFFACIRNSSDSKNWDGKMMRAFDLDFIRYFFAMLSRHWARLRVLTIALSPEHCGGWEPAEEVCRVAFEALGVTYPLPPP